MPETEVRLIRNDGSETFQLKAERVEMTTSNGFVTSSVISGASNEVLGSKLVLDMVTFQIAIKIQGHEASDYPNSSSYSDHDRGFAREIRRASEQWGYTVSDDLDELYWDGRRVGGVITEVSVSEDVNQQMQRTYTGDIEFTHVHTAI